MHTIFPELKTRAVVLGSLIRMITAANRYIKRGTVLHINGDHMGREGGLEVLQ